jgi:hypothetical protein
MTGFRVSKKTIRRQVEEGGPRARDMAAVLVPLATREEFAREIGTLWSEAQTKFLTIGRYLIQAKQDLPHGEFDEMVRRDLPFSRQIAHQLRTVASAIDSGRLVEDEIPHSYATVYFLATLSDNQLALARERGLVSPTTTRPQVLAFKRSLSEEGTIQLARRRDRLFADIRRREAELTELRQELAEIDQSLGMIEGTAIEVIEQSLKR